MFRLKTTSPKPVLHCIYRYFVLQIICQQPVINAMKTGLEECGLPEHVLTGGIGSSGRNEGSALIMICPTKEAYCENLRHRFSILGINRSNLLTGRK